MVLTLASCVVMALAVLLYFLNLQVASQTSAALTAPTPSPDLNQVWPGVLVVVPCRGEPDDLESLEAGLRAILTQDYPAFQVIFAVSDRADPALPLLSRLCRESPRASLVVSLPNDHRSLKLSNQLRALEQASEQDEVLVFLDADIHPPQDLLRRLVAPLWRPGVGASTGNRWYRATAASNLVGQLQAAWNAGGVNLLAAPSTCYAWGGSMAIRRQLFESCGVAEAWKRALTDDLTLTAAVKQAGYRIAFVPSCQSASDPETRAGRLLEFTTRQITLLHLYHRAAWNQLLVFEALIGGVLLGATATLLAGLANRSWLAAGTALAALGLVIAGRSIALGRVVRAVAQVTPELADAAMARRLALVAPLVGVVSLANLGMSAFHNRITWRGVRYHFDGPFDVNMITPAPAPPTQVAP